MNPFSQEVIYPLKMYIKLGRDKPTAYNSRQVLEAYKSFLKEHGEAWFPTNVLVLGIASRGKQSLRELLRKVRV